MGSILTPLQVDYFIKEIKILWPEQHKFQEDIALLFLHMKSYRIDDAIMSVIYD